MREIVYKYSTLGAYHTDANTAFGDDTQMEVVVEPHDFSIKLSGEVLRSSSCPGCTARVSRDGEVIFYDGADNVIGRVEKGEDVYPEFRLEWKQDFVTILFGRMVEVDNYPNCDGEYDRWSTAWQTRRTVTLNLKDNTVEVK